MSARKPNPTLANAALAAAVGMVVNRLAVMLLMGVPLIVAIALPLGSSEGSFYVSMGLAAAIGIVMCAAAGVAFGRVRSLSWGFAVGAAVNVAFAVLDALLKREAFGFVNALGYVALPVGFMVARVGWQSSRSHQPQPQSLL